MAPGSGYSRICVTGGAGFLGQSVTRRLRAAGYSDIFIPRRRDYDLRERAAVQKMFEDAQPDVVIHLAASVGGIGANRENPATFLYDNLMMGVHLVDEAFRRKLKKLVLLGTICSYPRFTPVPFKEDDLWNGYPEETNAPYGLAKKMLLAQAQAYRQQHGLDFIYLLPVNLYGPGDNFDLQSSHVIPALIRKCLEAKKAGRDHIDVWGSGKATREFLYVDDCADAIVTAMEKYSKPDPVNIGTGEEISVRELVGVVTRLTGFSGDVRWDATKPDGQPRRCLDVTRARQEFGWTAKTTLEEGLKRTIADYAAAHP